MSKIEELREYVLSHTVTDVQNEKFPAESAVDMVFMKVAPVNSPDVEVFRSLIEQSVDGVFIPLDLLTAPEASYIVVGAWIGDQCVAMRFMALGASLGLWSILSGASFGMPADLTLQLAGQGCLSIVIELTRQQALVMMRDRITGIRAYCDLMESLALDVDKMSDADIQKLINSTRAPCQGIRKAMEILPLDEKTRAAYEAIKVIVDQMRR